MFFLLSVAIDQLSILRDHLSYIEQKCRQVVAMKLPYAAGFQQGSGIVDGVSENEADELYIAVLDHLQKEDYKALRNRCGDSGMRTYLAVVIGNLYTDSIRRIRGKDLRRERALQFGVTGEAVYRHCIKGDYSLEAAQEFLASNHQVTTTIHELATIRDQIENRVKSDPDMVGKVVRADNHDDADNTPAFELRSDHGPDARLLEEQRDSLARQLLDEFEGKLNGTEKLIISMKFPAEDQEAKSFKEIAALLQTTPKTVEHAYYGCLTRFRECMMSRGISFDAVVSCES